MPTASIASEAAGRFGGLADRWMAASSYSPITWLATTTSAGTSARRVRTSSIACSASSTRLGSVRLGSVRGVRARWRVVGGLIGRGIVGHVSYPNGAISKRSGGDPHPATTTA